MYIQQQKVLHTGLFTCIVFQATENINLDDADIKLTIEEGQSSDISGDAEQAEELLPRTEDGTFNNTKGPRYRGEKPGGKRLKYVNRINKDQNLGAEGRSKSLLAAEHNREEEGSHNNAPKWSGGVANYFVPLIWTICLSVM